MIMGSHRVRHCCVTSIALAHKFCYNLVLILKPLKFSQLLQAWFLLHKLFHLLQESLFCFPTMSLAPFLLYLSRILILQDYTVFREPPAWSLSWLPFFFELCPFCFLLNSWYRLPGCAGRGVSPFSHSIWALRRNMIYIFKIFYHRDVA